MVCSQVFAFQEIRQLVQRRAASVPDEKAGRGAAQRQSAARVQAQQTAQHITGVKAVAGPRAFLRLSAERTG